MIHIRSERARDRRIEYEVTRGRVEYVLRSTRNSSSTSGQCRHGVGAKLIGDKGVAGLRRDSAELRRRIYETPNSRVETRIHVKKHAALTRDCAPGAGRDEIRSVRVRRVW